MQFSRYALPRSCGVCSGSSPGSVRLFSPGQVSPSQVVHSSVGPRRVSRGSSFVVCQPRSDHGPTTLPAHARLWVLARWGLVVVQLVILATHFFACLVMLLKGILAHCLSSNLSRTSVTNGVVGSLFLRMLVLSGLATLGCSTQAPLTTLLPLCLICRANK